MPLFFGRVAILDATVHGDLRLRPSGYGFAGATNAIPVGLAEFDIASQHFPIVFLAGDNPQPVVLVGYRNQQNLFVDPAGAWRRDAYIPAYVRAYPFILVERVGAADTLHLGVDLDADCLSKTEGAALFERGKPARGLGEAIGFCKAYRDNLAETRAFVAAMVEADVLEERSATLTLNGGGFTRLDGFLQISAEKFKALDDATWLGWRRRGWIDAAYAHLHSAGRWGQLVDVDR
jgi:hypothetical protein